MVLEFGRTLQMFPAPKNKGIYEEKAVIFEQVWKLAFWAHYRARACPEMAQGVI